MRCARRSPRRSICSIRSLVRVALVAGVGVFSTVALCRLSSCRMRSPVGKALSDGDDSVCLDLEAPVDCAVFLVALTLAAVSWMVWAFVER